jgi:hypothetical protein
MVEHDKRGVAASLRAPCEKPPKTTQPLKTVLKKRLVSGEDEPIGFTATLRIYKNQ